MKLLLGRLITGGGDLHSGDSETGSRMLMGVTSSIRESPVLPMRGAGAAVAACRGATCDSSSVFAVPW